jgi:deoxycytidine triphosphate deaminase
MATIDPNLTTRKEREKKRLLALQERCPRDDKDFPFTGVLLSDAIKKCCDAFGLITPFAEDNLKPANYKLRIGDEYAIRGEIRPLSDTPGKNEIVIRPFEVAIIKTLETINMPRFLIGRWNIQVSKAYKGLLWVGGPQVDAGYVGNLFCPIYNLSDQTVILHYGEPIAVIDFEKTTHFHEGTSKPYSNGGLPERILFQDYEPESLQSALATQVQKNIRKFRTNLESLSTRMDTFVTITFALLGILFAAGALFVTEPERPHWWNISIFFVCLVAIALAGWALVRSHSAESSLSRTPQIILWIALLVLLGGSFLRTEQLAKQISQLKDQVQKIAKDPSQQTPP